MLALLTLTIFLGSALLFLVQPMAAKELLPRLGGSPAVWTAAMLFFQTALLAGYAWAHALAARARRGPLAHLILAAATCALLPVGLRAADPGNAPTAWLLGALAVGYGLPLVVLAAGAPTLQRWFSRSGHPRARDPYFLYVASNVGSLVALLAYPLLVEPALALARQRTLWSVGYAVAIALTAACAISLRRTSTRGTDPDPVSTRTVPPTTSLDSAPPSRRVRLTWLILAAIPSSLCLGVTQHLSTDVAAAPLLWVLPLSIYLLSFVVAFASRPILDLGSLARLAPLIVVVLVLVALVRGFRLPAFALVSVHLLGLAILATLCHSILALRRPHPARLTEFYLVVALGGALGGVFNAIVAPAIFHGVYEYPIALVAAIATRALLPVERAPMPRAARAASLVLDAAIALAIASALPILYRLTGRAGIDDGSVRVGIACGVPVLLLYLTKDRPVRFALVAAALFLSSHLLPDASGTTLRRVRTFFGVYRVSSTGAAITITHGTTVHGKQFTDPSRRADPLTYYHRDGPLGSLWASLGPERTRRVGAVGLGAGAIAAYTQPGDALTFFEIDPAVARIARDPALFTHVADAKGDVSVVLGDGRRSLAAAPPASFDLLILDAFSSDAIPMHLLTREALAVYRRALAPDGVLAIHASNQFLDLPPIIARLAEDAGLEALSRWDDRVTPIESIRTGRLQSHWIVLARPADMPPSLRSRGWLPLAPSPGTPLWTDDAASIVPIILWR